VNKLFHIFINFLAFFNTQLSCCLVTYYGVAQFVEKYVSSIKKKLKATLTADTISYCATLHVSVVFAVVRCLYVCVTLVDCIEMAEDIVKLLSLSGSPVILVF